MTRMTLNRVPDLLQGRRLELGLPAAPVPIQPAWRLLLPGAVLCAMAVFVPLLMQWSLQLRERHLQRELDSLAPVEQQLTTARSTLQRLTKRTESLQRDTAQITAQMVSVRSGSAFLEQLKRATPTAVGLQSVTVQPSEVNITGSAENGPTVPSGATAATRQKYDPGAIPSIVAVVLARRESYSGSANSGSVAIVSW